MCIRDSFGPGAYDHAQCSFNASYMQDKSGKLRALTRFSHRRPEPDAVHRLRSHLLHLSLIHILAAAVGDASLLSPVQEGRGGVEEGVEDVHEDEVREGDEHLEMCIRDSYCRVLIKKKRS